MKKIPIYNDNNPKNKETSLFKISETNLNNNDNEIKNVFEKNKEISFYQKYKFYRFLSFLLLILNIPIIYISVILTTKNDENKYKTSREKKYNYKNRKVKIPEFNSNESFKISLNNIPKLPENKEEHKIKQPYNITYYDKTNIRYHFKDLFNKRKLFLIDYNDSSYQKIRRSISFDENADNIFQSTGMLNLSKLEFYYYTNSKITDNLNNIHLGMSFDKNYILLSSISIASILNTSSENTYIHFHIILNNCTYKDFKPLSDLKKINENVNFIFYNGKQAEYDFSRGISEIRGIGEYSRFLIPEIVNNTNKILILDSGDILAMKDLSEIYFFELGDNYCAFSLENIAGRYDDVWIFGRNNYYPNGGVTLINVKKFREDKLYKNAFYASFSYEYLPCPFQEILLMISNFKFTYFPLSYNCIQFFENKDNFTKNNFTSKEINIWLEMQELSPFKYSKEEIVNASLNPVIIHLYPSKPYYNLANEKHTEMWINYAKMIGILEKIKEKYPQPFNNKKK